MAALYQLIIVIFFTLALAMLELSSGHKLKGSVTCLDCCDTHYDLSDIKVQVKCSEVKRSALAITKKDGSFQTELPLDTTSTSPTPFNCLARILGGPNQMYTSRKDMISTIVKAQEYEFYTVSKPLNFYTSCPVSHKDGNCGATNSGIGSSKTIDLPLPKEWGLAPTSYYFNPYTPIIGIP